jgi:hypothetical protein
VVLVAQSLLSGAFREDSLDRATVEQESGVGPDMRDGSSFGFGSEP